MEGIILEAESGDYLGKHRGFWFYTIGQRQGLRLPGGPWYVPSFDAFSTISCPVIIIVSPYCLLLQWGKVFPSSYKYVCFIRPETHLTIKAFHISCRYVVEKDVQNNVVFVSRNYYSLDKRRRTFRVGSLNWFDNSGPGNNEQLKCKVTGYYIQ